MRIIAPLISAIAIAGIAVGNARPTVASVPADTLYGSALVELGDPGERSIVTIDQNDGSITWLEPQSENFKGLAFDSDGRLFATDCDPYGFGTRCILVSEPTSLLMELDPVTGAILNTIGTVTDAFGFRPTIETLSVQPGTDILYGFGGFWGSRDVEMWMIDKSTAIATLVASFGPCISSGSTPSLRGCGLGYGFAPDGTLYHLASDHSGRVGWLDHAGPQHRRVDHIHTARSSDRGLVWRGARGAKRWDRLLLAVLFDSDSAPLRVVSAPTPHYYHPPPVDH